MPMFIRRPQQAQVVEAEQLGPGSQAHPQGARPGRPGDWLITDHSTGQQTVMGPEDFSTLYEPIAIPNTAMENQLRAANPNWAPGLLLPGAEGAPGPQAEAPYSPPPGGSGDVAPPNQPMNDQLPGRPSVAPEQRPRLESAEPVTTPTGLPEQPGDADKEYREDQAPEEHPPGWTPNPEESPPPGTF